MCNYIGILAHGRMIFEGDLLELMPVSMEEIFIEKLTGQAPISLKPVRRGGDTDEE